MAKKKLDKLRVIELFARDVAQSIWGGIQTAINSKYGDLYDEEGYVFAEVKGAGDSQGVIVRKSQLELHMEGLGHCRREYVLVYYKNVGKHKDKRRSLTSIVGTTKARLQNFLAERTREMYIVDVRVVNAIYQVWKAKDERNWNMKEGLRTGLKLRACRFLPYVQDVQRLSELQLDPVEYVASQQQESAHFGDREIPVTVFRILRKDSDV